MCNGTWIVEEADLEKQRVCPCCATSIQRKVEFEAYDSLDKAIYGAVAKMGDGVLWNLRQLSGFMMDTAPNLKKEIRIFSKTVSDDYMAPIRTLFEQVEQDIAAAETTIIKLRQLFIEEDGLSEAWADMICEALYGAAMYYNGRGITEMVNISIEDVLPDCNAHQLSTSEILHEVKKQGNNTTTDDQGDNDTDAALEEYRLAANRGYVPAYNSIASIYYSKKNYKKAWKWYLKAADANDPEGQYYVGIFYLNGLHVKKNIHMAIKYFEKSADQKYEHATLARAELYLALAELYINGTGCQKDEKKALRLLTIAAENGNAKAQYKLGELYQMGGVVNKDVTQAAHWYRQAVMLEYPDAKQRLDECIMEMPLTQRFKWKLY